MAATNTTDPVDPPGESSEDPAPLPEAEARRRHQQEIVRRVLAAGGDYGDAADEADISRRTVARWMSDPTFAKSVSDARAEQVQAVTGQLTSLADGAVLVLSELLVEGTNPERLRAAQMVLDWGTRLRRDTEIEARVLELETRLGLADPRGDEEGDPR
jgi:hypothetical protein